MDWYYGLKHLGLIFCYGSGWCRFSQSRLLRVYHMKATLHFWMLFLFLFTVSTRIRCVATIRAGKLHSSKRLLRKSVKAFAQKVVISFLNIHFQQFCNITHVAAYLSHRRCKNNPLVREEKCIQLGFECTDSNSALQNICAVKIVEAVFSRDYCLS
jgi:hypothetical protein